MERTVKEKMSTFLEIESAMPQDLINAKANYNCLIKRFFCNFTTYHNSWIKQILYPKSRIKEEFQL